MGSDTRKLGAPLGAPFFPVPRFNKLVKLKACVRAIGIALVAFLLIGDLAGGAYLYSLIEQKAAEGKQTHPVLKH